MAKQMEDPRDKAQRYAESGGEQPAKPARAKSEAELRDAVSEAIEKAMRDGKFDRLPGRGKPLHLERDPFAPEGVDSAWRLLKNNEMVPGWILARGEVLREIETWRAYLIVRATRLSKEWSQADAVQKEAILARWPKQHEVIQESMQKLNRRIRDLNLQQPVSHLEVFQLRLDEELRLSGFPEELR